MIKLKRLLAEIITEIVAGDNHNFDKLIPYIESKLKFKIGKYLSSGSKSDIFELGGNKVLKITSGTNDANAMFFAKEHPNYPIIKVFGVYKINSENLPNDLKPDNPNGLYIIISEKLKTRDFTLDEEADLEDWFLQNTKYIPNDVFSDNMGVNSSGKIVYLDPSFKNMENNLSKIPIL